MIRLKPIKKVNNVYQIDEGIFDVLKAIITGKRSDITKIPDNELSKAGKDLKKATVALLTKKLQKSCKKLNKKLNKNTDNSSCIIFVFVYFCVLFIHRVHMYITIFIYVFQYQARTVRTDRLLLLILYFVMDFYMC